jgi:hypothetical protein
MRITKNAHAQQRISAITYEHLADIHLAHRDIPVAPLRWRPHHDRIPIEAAPFPAGTVANLALTSPHGRSAVAQPVYRLCRDRRTCAAPEYCSANASIPFFAVAVFLTACDDGGP